MNTIRGSSYVEINPYKIENSSSRKFNRSGKKERKSPRKKNRRHKSCCLVDLWRRTEDLRRWDHQITTAGDRARTIPFPSEPMPLRYRF